MDENKKILIVEDDSFLAKMLSRTIEELQYTVLLAGTGEEGWRKASEPGVALILLDIMLPDLDGFEVLKRIKNNTATQHIPVIIVSNLGQPQDEKRGHELGASDYIIKSNVSLDEVAARVKKLLPA